MSESKSPLLHPRTEKATWPGHVSSGCRYNVGQGGVHVRCSGSPGSGLCQTWTSVHSAHHRGQPGTVRPQVSSFLAEETRGMGESHSVTVMDPLWRTRSQISSLSWLSLWAFWYLWDWSKISVCNFCSTKWKNATSTTEPWLLAWLQPGRQIYLLISFRGLGLVS